MRPGRPSATRPAAAARGLRGEQRRTRSLALRAAWARAEGRGALAGDRRTARHREPSAPAETPSFTVGPVRVLVIDNYDSFTYNLVQYLGELGADVEVVRNDHATRRRAAGPRL